MLARAYENGESHLIRNVEIRERVVMGEDGVTPVLETRTRVRLHNAQSAVRQLCTVFGLVKLSPPDAKGVRRVEKAVERLM